MTFELYVEVDEYMRAHIVAYFASSDYKKTKQEQINMAIFVW